MKDWEKYEYQIFEKLQSDFPNGEILKNQKIKGVFSKRSRQIDILINGNLIGKKIIGVIDCKKFSKKITVKNVESFIGFLEDVGANLGIMITNIGYSKSAKKRIENYTRDIRLDIIEFEDFENYQFNWDECDLCRNDTGIAKGEIIWFEPLSLIKDGIITLIQAGNCSSCNATYIKCQGCGQIVHIEHNENKCYCENTFYIQSENVGNGLIEEYVKIRMKGENKPEFINPNQMKLFD